MSTHAILAPSSAHRWMECLAAPAMERGLPDNNSEYSSEGTLAHTFAAAALALPEDEGNAYMDEQVGVVYVLDGNSVYLDAEGMDYVKTYVSNIRHYITEGAQGWVEQPLPVGLITGEVNEDGEPATGTGDVVIFKPAERKLEIHDLKFGKGVYVDPTDNPQLMLYGAGAWLSGMFCAKEDIDRVLLVIHQPRISPAPIEWDCPIEWLEKFIGVAERRAAHAMAVYNGEAEPEFKAEEHVCQWCKAKSRCPAQAALVSKLTGLDFEDLTQDRIAIMPSNMSVSSLSNMMAKVGLVEDWCKDVRAAVEAALIQGIPVEGWKLVEGKKGARKWVDEADAEATMKSMRLKTEEMYDMKIISPTTAEKRLKEHKRKWNRLQGLITQAPGKPSVAPESDKRPALSTANDFSDITS